ncbi:NfuA Fe-S protein maturation [Salmonella enterica subsp. arizonae]|uniref:NfuA Fe-S protein maturation n=1 Tax=Salmonella enterica subsp. arizonae TaxID=59203 RepID=A0A2X4W895_SALER|nr:NfuA Fe-S protein maturation [Salmonella enterica subsp. arizonae]
MRKVADDAPLMERVEYVLQSQINPQLAGHGGRVSLMEITDEGYAILQFGGGCNGCSMVDVTLKEGIEKQLLNEFPELKGVRDLTEHQRGEHSYLLRFYPPPCPMALALIGPTACTTVVPIRRLRRHPALSATSHNNGLSFPR